MACSSTPVSTKTRGGDGGTALTIRASAFRPRSELPGAGSWLQPAFERAAVGAAEALELQRLAHRALVGVVVPHLFGQQFADQARDAGVATGRLHARPVGDLI